VQHLLAGGKMGHGVWNPGNTFFCSAISLFDIGRGLQPQNFLNKLMYTF